MIWILRISSKQDDVSIRCLSCESHSHARYYADVDSCRMQLTCRSLGGSDREGEALFREGFVETTVHDDLAQHLDNFLWGKGRKLSWC